jgi:ribosomal protein S18 acetylase RimI-like enzyme
MINTNQTENDVLIRTVNFIEDYDTLVELWANAGPGVHLGRSDQQEELLKKIRRDPDLFLAAEVLGKIVGAVLGGYDGRRGLVYHLAVAHNFRRRGIAKVLMDELESRLEKKGCVKYYLLVTRDNIGALEFYKQYGCDVMDLNVLGKEI